MAKVVHCKWCDTEFVQKHFNNAYCSDDCRYMANKESKRKSAKKKATECKKPKVTMEQMVETMDRLSKERGKYVSYGDVQKELTTGKLKVKGGVIIANQVR